MDGGHEALDDAKVIMENLGERGKAIGGAGGVGDDIGHICLVRFLIHTHDEHGRIRRGGGDDHLLSATLQVGLGLLGCGEYTGGLNDVIGTGVLPWNIGGILLGVKFDGLTVDDKILTFDFNGSLELPVLGVIFEHVGLI